MGLIWTKLLIALRGSARESGEAIDAAVVLQALRILDHEIGETQAQLDAGRSSLANLMTKSILADREVGQTTEQLSQLTVGIGNALALGREESALELAIQIGTLERLLLEDKRIADEYSRSEEDLRQALEAHESQLVALRKQVDGIRATDLGHYPAPGSSAARREPLARLQAVADALDAIRQHQLQTVAQLQSQEMRCMHDRSLEKRQDNASILFDQAAARVVLERIRTQELALGS